MSRKEAVMLKLYRLADIGMMYCPDGSRKNARYRAREMIRTIPGLKEALENAGWRERHQFTPRQRDIFLEFVGRPES